MGDKRMVLRMQHGRFARIDALKRIIRQCREVDRTCRLHAQIQGAVTSDHSLRYIQYACRERGNVAMSIKIVHRA